MAFIMAAVAPPRLEARSVNIEYSTAGHPVDVKVEREYTTAVSNTNQTLKQVGGLERQIQRGEEMEVDNVDEESAVEEILTKDSEVVEDDISEQEQSSEDEHSDESNSFPETPSKTNWEKKYSASVEESIDVAGRDNCVLV